MYNVDLLDAECWQLNHNKHREVSLATEENISKKKHVRSKKKHNNQHRCPKADEVERKQITPATDEAENRTEYTSEMDSHRSNNKWEKNI
ncbi:unnamed protein product [Ceratitis capitata]|uniref:(Mediterranean fruit fly) hypothetical protein n=1 Tax=Ceratitis capitata TaxID=7213 RepID=A0A811V5X7_CERCA|nr:unnamed protein product [Ceratitis capitata]